jgi:hypothetical protein
MSNQDLTGTMVETTAAINAMRPGQYLICDIFDRPLRITDYLASGLGHIYRPTRNADGRMQFVRVQF